MENKTQKTKAQRAKNFTETEISILTAECDKHRGVLFGPLKGASLTQYHRDRAWEKVEQAVNAVAPALRSVQDLKKKFKDLKGRAKAKANLNKREARKTGGGENEAIPLSTMEESLLTFVGRDSIEGIAGGVDTFRAKILNNPAVSSVAPLPSSLPSTSKRPPPLSSPDVPSWNVWSPVISASSVKRQAPCTISTRPASPPSSTGSPISRWSPLPITPQQPNPFNIEAIIDPPAMFLQDLVDAVDEEEPVGVAIVEPAQKRRVNTKTRALQEMQKSATLQVETNNLMKEMIAEFKDFKNQHLLLEKQKLELKKRELDLLEEQLTIKRRRFK